MPYIHSHRCATAVGAAISYAKPIGGYDDPDILTISRCTARLEAAFDQDVWKVNFYSWLRYVPGYLRELHAGHQEELDLFKQNLQRVRGMIVSLLWISYVNPVYLLDAPTGPR